MSQLKSSSISQHLSPHRLSANEVLLNAYLSPTASGHLNHLANASTRNSGDEHFLLGLQQQQQQQQQQQRKTQDGVLAASSSSNDMPAANFHHIMHEEPEQLIHQSVEQPFQDNQLHQNGR